MSEKQQKVVDETLKPCPFCGGEATMETSGYDNYFGSCFPCSTESELEPTKELAAKRWNNRPIEDALQSKIREAESVEPHVGRLQDLEEHYREVHMSKEADSIRCAWHHLRTNKDYWASL